MCFPLTCSTSKFVKQCYKFHNNTTTIESENLFNTYPVGFIKSNFVGHLVKRNFSHVFVSMWLKIFALVKATRLQWLKMVIKKKKGDNRVQDEKYRNYPLTTRHKLSSRISAITKEHNFACTNLANIIINLFCIDYLTLCRVEKKKSADQNGQS